MRGPGGEVDVLDQVLSPASSASNRACNIQSVLTSQLQLLPYPWCWLASQAGCRGCNYQHRGGPSSVCQIKQRSLGCLISEYPPLPPSCCTFSNLLWKQQSVVRPSWRSIKAKQTKCYKSFIQSSLKLVLRPDTQPGHINTRQQPH